MKLMKRFTLLIAVALVLTVGGVYANWTYNTATGDLLAEANAKPLLTNIVLQNDSVGSIQKMQSSVEVKIDDEDNDHVADLQITGDIVFLYESKETNTTLYWAIMENGTAAEYDGTQIFKTSIAATGIPTDGTRSALLHNDASAGGNGYCGDVFGMGLDWSDYFDEAKTIYAIIIKAEDLAAVLDLNTTFTLDTVESYYAFKDAIASTEFNIAIGSNPDTLLTTVAG